MANGHRSDTFASDGLTINHSIYLQDIPYSPRLGENLMRSWKVFALALIATATVMPLTVAEDGKAIKKAMKEGFKPKSGIFHSVVAGDASADDKKKLLALVTDMAKEMPPKGDEASWKEKTSALIQASQDVVAGKEGSIDNLKKAGNCKACHSVHKGK